MHEGLNPNLGTGFVDQKQFRDNLRRCFIAHFTSFANRAGAYRFRLGIPLWGNELGHAKNKNGVEALLTFTRVQNVQIRCY